MSQWKKNETVPKMKQFTKSYSIYTHNVINGKVRLSIRFVCVLTFAATFEHFELFSQKSRKRTRSLNYRNSMRLFKIKLNTVFECTNFSAEIAFFTNVRRLLVRVRTTNGNNCQAFEQKS